MSKDKPEVGDVWVVDFAKYIILHIKNDTALCFVSDSRFAEFDISILQQFCVYLGKSRVEINELFEVKEKYDA